MLLLWATNSTVIGGKGEITWSLFDDQTYVNVRPCGSQGVNVQG